MTLNQGGTSRNYGERELTTAHIKSSQYLPHPSPPRDETLLD